MRYENEPVLKIRKVTIPRGIAEENPINFHTRDSLRAWLGENGARETGVWVLIRKVRGCGGGILYTDAVEEALCSGWIDGKMKSLDPQTYKLWFSPRRRGSIWSKSNRERVEAKRPETRKRRIGVVLDRAGKNLKPGIDL